MTLAQSILVVFVLGAVPVVAFAWASLALQSYVRLLASGRHERNPLVESDELMSRYQRRRWRWFIEAPSLVLRASRDAFEPQSNPVLEQARKRYLFRRRLSLLSFVVVVIALVVVFRPT